MPEGIGVLDALNIYSVYLALLNLQENREQSAHNDVAAANDAQAKFLLAELDRKFKEQNAMLREIIGELRHERDQGDSSVHQC